MGAAKKDNKVSAAAFNIVDDCATTQADIAKVISEVVGVEAGFHGTLISTFAKMNMGDVIVDVNEKVCRLPPPAIVLFVVLTTTRPPSTSKGGPLSSRPATLP